MGPWGGAPLQPKPNNYLVWGLLTTLLCCLPFGIVSIVYASQVDSKWAMGDYAGAANASTRAKQWAIASALSALVLFGGLILIGILATVAGNAS